MSILLDFLSISFMLMAFFEEPACCNQLIFIYPAETIKTAFSLVLIGFSEGPRHISNIGFSMKLLL